MNSLLNYFYISGLNSTLLFFCLAIVVLSGSLGKSKLIKFTFVLLVCIGLLLDGLVFKLIINLFLTYICYFAINISISNKYAKNRVALLFTILIVGIMGQLLIQGVHIFNANSLLDTILIDNNVALTILLVFNLFFPSILLLNEFDPLYHPLLRLMTFYLYFSCYHFLTIYLSNDSYYSRVHLNKEMIFGASVVFMIFMAFYTKRKSSLHIFLLSLYYCIGLIFYNYDKSPLGLLNSEGLIFLSLIIVLTDKYIDHRWSLMLLIGYIFNVIFIPGSIASSIYLSTIKSMSGNLSITLYVVSIFILFYVSFSCLIKDINTNNSNQLNLR